MESAFIFYLSVHFFWWSINPVFDGHHFTNSEVFGAFLFSILSSQRAQRYLLYTSGGFVFLNVTYGLVLIYVSFDYAASLLVFSSEFVVSFDADMELHLNFEVLAVFLF